MNKQELLDEFNKVMGLTTGNIFSSGVKSGLEVGIRLVEQLDEPTKVEPLVVPKGLAMWLSEQYLGEEGSLFTIIKKLDDMWFTGEFLDFITDNKKELIEVILGTRQYEVEKEKLYRVEMSGTDNLLLTLEGSEYYFDEQIDYIGDKPNIRQEFTEKEIKAIDERYWEFAVEVEQDDDSIAEEEEKK